MTTNNDYMEGMSFHGPFHCTVEHHDRELYHYHLHWHSFMELIFIKKGYFKASLRNTKFLLNEGDLLVVIPGELHSFGYEGDNVLEFINIQFDPIILQSAIPDSKEFAMIYPYLFSYKPPLSFLCRSDDIAQKQVSSIINNIHQETLRKELGYSLSIRANLLELFVCLLRKWNLDTPGTPMNENFTVYKRMFPVFNMIQEQYMKNFSTTKMAKMAAMSVPHFCRLFKKITGCGFRGYLQSLRISEAIKLLLSTDFNITQIASLVGYSDVNFFIRIFKNQTGLPPLQYKNKWGGGGGAI
jgi:AraC-like DNA-binding protein